MSKQAAGQLIIDIDPPKPKAQVDAEPETHALAVVPTSPVDLLAMAIDRNLDIEKLRELMALEREWRADKAKGEFAAAMAKFGELKKTVAHNRKGKTAGNTEFSYSDYPQMLDAITPWLAECGLSFDHMRGETLHSPDGKVSCVMIQCRIKHRAGHFEDYPPVVAIPDTRLEGKVSPNQLIQMATTYAKRQSLAEALGLATKEDKNDDDSHGQVVKAISEKQAADLRALAEELGVDKKDILDLGDADSIETIPVANYAKVMNALYARRRGTQKGGTR